MWAPWRTPPPEAPVVAVDINPPPDVVFGTRVMISPDGRSLVAQSRTGGIGTSAETDLLESALFIAEDDPAAAQRFLDEAENAFTRLAEFAEIGSPRTASDPTLAGLRLLPVPGFEKFRICCIP